LLPSGAAPASHWDTIARRDYSVLSARFVSYNYAKLSRTGETSNQAL